jgi:regulator of protease activity HflC (stomatin/prohibitin superfamily)
MPVLWIIAVILFVLTPIALAIAFMTSDRDDAGVFAGIAGACVAFGLIFTLISSADSVPVRNVGIVESFHKPTGEVTGSGLIWHKPWENVGEWDASRQRYDHSQEKNAIAVRTGTLATARVQVLIEWQVKPERAPEQFKDYKGNFDTFRDQRVGIQLDGAMNDAFASYVPLANIDSNTGNLNVDLKPFAEKVRTFANDRLGDDVNILSVTIVRVIHDDKTEANIKAFQDKLAQTRNLLQDQKNAEIQKKITETNAQVDKVTRCLEIADKNGTNPGLCINPGIVTGK